MRLSGKPRLVSIVIIAVLAFSTGALAQDADSTSDVKAVEKADKTGIKPIKKTKVRNIT